MRTGVAFAASLAALASACRTPAATAEIGIGALAWLEGTWNCISGPNELVEERWSSLRGGMMLGSGRTLRRGEEAERAVAFEFLRIEIRSGEVVYIAQPGGRAPGTEFVLRSASDTAWSFENPAHDFPRLIHYERLDDARMRVQLSGEEQGTPTELSLLFERAAGA
jgi:hypothetical protein